MDRRLQIEGVLRAHIDSFQERVGGTHEPQERLPWPTDAHRKRVQVFSGENLTREVDVEQIVAETGDSLANKERVSYHDYRLDIT